MAPKRKPATVAIVQTKLQRLEEQLALAKRLSPVDTGDLYMNRLKAERVAGWAAVAAQPPYATFTDTKQQFVHEFFPPPPGFHNLDVLKAIYKEVNALRVKGKRTKKLREAMQREQLPFEDYAAIMLHTYVDKQNRKVVYFSLELKEPGRCLGFMTHWLCRIYADFTICTGLSAWSVYDGQPIVSPAQFLVAD